MLRLILYEVVAASGLYRNIQRYCAALRSTSSHHRRGAHLLHHTPQWSCIYALLVDHVGPSSIRNTHSQFVLSIMADILPTSHLAYGFITHTFGLEQAAELWRRILGRETSHLPPVFAQNGEDMSIKLYTGHCPKPPGAYEENGAWIKDYLPNTGAHGPVVRQTLYVPRIKNTESAREQHYRGLQAPIFFLRNDDSHFLHVGINLATANAGDAHILIGANDPFTRFGKIQKTTLVLAWERYATYDDQLLIWDRRTKDDATMPTVTFGQFVKKVAGWTCRALQRSSIPVHPSSIWLVGLVPVSTGHWQVVLQFQ
ncbi:hypothetical protein PENSPDRAFT_748822, partial [Peniophora sp. CONT]